MQKEEKGSALVIVCIMLTVLLGFSAFVIDFTLVYGQQRKFQNALNASALAGCNDLPNTDLAKEASDKYIQLNGFQPSDILISFAQGNKVINITGTKDVDLAFAKLFGFDKTTIKLKASASRAGIPPAFKFAIFSGSPSDTLQMNGTGNTVAGGIHSNASFDSNGSKLSVTGGIQAVETVAFNERSAEVDSIKEGVESIKMPDFGDVVKKVAEDSGTYYNGEKTFNSSKVSVDKPIFVNGDLTINGSSFIGKGTVVATGDIIFNGSSVRGSSDDAVCFYSTKGNIIFNGAKAEISGVIYVPNGEMVFNGSNQTVDGRVIANTVTLNGSDLTVKSNEGDIESLPYALYVKLIVPE